ncbi:MAG: zeta toxin family protein [Acetatifactor sp.]
MKKYILIAGVNGAGKSTLYQTLESLKQMERINTDEIVRTFGDWRNPFDVIQAGKIAVTKIKDCFDKGISFNQETTLCGNSIVKNIELAKALGYEIELHYVGVESVEIAKARIAYRVEHGGHGISDADVERRYIESFEQLNRVKEKCDLVVLYDNTEAFKRFAIYQNGSLYGKTESIPMWFEKYVK